VTAHQKNDAHATIRTSQRDTTHSDPKHQRPSPRTSTHNGARVPCLLFLLFCVVYNSTVCSLFGSEAEWVRGSRYTTCMGYGGGLPWVCDTVTSVTVKSVGPNGSNSGSILSGRVCGRACAHGRACSHACYACWREPDCQSLHSARPLRHLAACGGRSDASPDG
jgi:hypothetical protein